MATGKMLRKLIKAGSSGDTAAFKLLSEAVIEEERQKQHHLLANDLERILYGMSAPKQSRLGVIPKIPEDKERGLPLLSMHEPKRGLDEIILSSKTKCILEDILEEHRRVDILMSYGMKPVEKVLFYGPPGCGKTLASEVIAFELERPLVIIKLDVIMSSFLGETAANLRKVFDFIAKHPFVALFDEFDAIGKARTVQGDHGELRRVLNAVLQMIDSYQGKSIILAATNHEKILDTALWRRFDEIVHFQLADRSMLVDFLELKLRGIRRNFETDDPALIKKLDGMSSADIERVIKRAIKKMILRKQEFLGIKQLLESLSRENHTQQV